MNSLAPIVLFVYNRPKHTLQTIHALQKNEYADKSDLIIFADGPKSNADSITIENIKEVRNIIHKISGFKDIIINESEKNIGLDTSVINGVTKVLDSYGKAIVVEDDIVTHPSFLHFMNDCLNTYQNQDNIYMVTGYNHNIRVPNWYHKDVYSVHRGCSWGWGIWKNRWNKADWSMQGYEKIVQNKKAAKKFTRAGKDMLPLLIDQMKEEVPAWDIRWDFCLYTHDAFCIRPVNSLVLNIGLDGSGAHNGIDNPWKKTAPFPKTDVFSYNLPFPIEFSSFLEYRLRSFIDGDPTIFQRLSYSIKKRFKKI